MKNSFFSYLGIFLIGLWAGGQIVMSSWNGLVYLAMDSKDKGRSPSGLPKRLDFYHLSGNAFTSQAKQRVVEEMQVMRDSGSVGIVLGNFAMKTEGGQRQLACDSFNQVEIVLEAEGVAVSGEKPTIVVRSPCNYTSDHIDQIAPIWIPLNKFRQEKPTHFTETTENEVRYSFRSMGHDWPEQWNVASVRLLNEDENRELAVGQGEILKMTKNKPFLFNTDESTLRNTAGQK